MHAFHTFTFAAMVAGCLCSPLANGQPSAASFTLAKDPIVQFENLTETIERINAASPPPPNLDISQPWPLFKYNMLGNSSWVVTMIDQSVEAVFIHRSHFPRDGRTEKKSLTTRQSGEPDQITMGVGGTNTCTPIVIEVIENDSCVTPPPNTFAFFRGLEYLQGQHIRVCPDYGLPCGFYKMCITTTGYCTQGGTYEVSVSRECDNDTISDMCFHD
ncbi:uncharacterized protein ACLA_078520 [Aspergillus clavatus NRRL 1]|uniref:Uncharacterized protein n=1 Tax=Aspergillus clavatus (strain ATCC 1007 / CBS 513.65 / DSM 816 / NCTC 3887 / NRRL 1 / QM 1276 / 107) TaxID=344612 RepID=A1CLX4_ASPCL|nr:uncharacterized protein ACLA_078520 [Aspergillus clavatus NRRL 1]EAW09103.1 hypothetical protein ACLA_078520 [Aspergillus clavatus NRRL 1]